MGPVCILLPAAGAPELLPSDACAHDVLGPGPLLRAPARAGAAAARGGAARSDLAWAHPRSAYAEHNCCASRIAGQAVRGDACLFMSDVSAADLRSLLMGRPPPPPPRDAAAPAAPRPGGAPAAAGGGAAQTCKRPHLDGRVQGAPAGAAAAAAPGAAAPGAALGGAAPPAPPTAPWKDLPAHVIAAVALRVGPSVAQVMPLLGTCRPWQAAVLDDDALLRRLRFALDTRAPFRGDHRPPPAALRARLQRAARHPRLLQRAAHLGNLGALLTSARLLDAGGAPADAMRHWKRAAKAGHAEAQLVVGLAAYRGSGGVPQDPEGAALWLGKALKQVQPADAEPAPRGGAPPPRRGAPPPAAPPPPPPAAAATVDPEMAVDAATRARVLREASLVLGYLHFDGEGAAQDATRAAALFRAAAAAGCQEAAKTLGWIYNTGQF
ncbi:MAG: hypothetical protein J3K34DRAFT_494207 [Monoraphidium minutum]|nr:MAG: hypothetical protein J3K34DRAFT_494207 [Monoraphidium minutum]